MKELNINNITKSCINIPHIYHVTGQHLQLTSEKTETQLYTVSYKGVFLNLNVVRFAIQ